MKILQYLNARILVGTLLILGLGWIWLSRIPADAPKNQAFASPQIGFLAPNFELEDLNGQKIELSSYKNKVVLVNFWASWCPPCKAEMPTLENIYTKYNGPDFEILAVNSTVQDSLPEVQNFVKATQLTFPILLDKDGFATHLYNIQSLPVSYFIGRDGIIRDIVVGGPMPEAMLIRKIDLMLNGGY